MLQLLISALGLGLLGIALVLAPASSLAEEDSLDSFGDADFDAAFEEFDEGVPDTEPRGGGRDFLEITGSLGFETAYNYDSRAPVIYSPPNGKADWHGFSKARFTGRLQADLYLPQEWKGRLSATGFYDRIYAIHGRTDYTPETLREQEIEYEIAEAYLQGSLTPFLDLKTGRQVVNWGYSDSFRVLDVLNPLDNREPGLVDIEDLRLPVTMTVLEAFFGDWTLSGVAVHEFRAPKNPPRGSDFFPIFGPSVPNEEPDQWDVFNESAVSLLGSVKGVDLSFRYASVYDDDAHLSITFPDGVTPLLKTKYNKIDLYGMGAQGTKGSWLFKTETAYRDNLEFSSSDDKKTVGRLDTFFGVEYYGFPNNQTLSLEVVHQHHHHWDRAYFAFPDVKQRNNSNVAFRYTSNYLNERLEFLALAILLGQWNDGSLRRDGGLYRLSLEYEATDHINLIGTVVMYQGGANPYLDFLRYSDRVDLRMEYNF